MGYKSFRLSLIETNDLIYEGIATNNSNSIFTYNNETNDLIYEGIATVTCKHFINHLTCETNDLIYEGIATKSKTLKGLKILRGNKRPDLRRDCDAIVICFNPCFYFETNDLIYEGIATRYSLAAFHASESRNKRPDLRRDCDFLLLFDSCIFPLKQTT